MKRPDSPREIIIKAVIDAGPLFTVLTLSYVRSIRASEEKKNSILGRAIDMDLLRRAERQEACLHLFNGISSVITTSHVIGELQGRQKSIKTHDKELYGDDLRNFWLHTMELLRRKHLDERLLRLLDLHARDESRETVCIVGSTDAGLIELARQEGCPLLTDDERTLARRAWELGIDCRLIKNLID